MRSSTDENKRMVLSFKRFMRESKKANLSIVDLSFCRFPSFVTLNPLLESIKRRMSRIGNDFVVLFPNDESLRWARRNLPKYGRNLIRIPQDELAVQRWLSEMYFDRNYKNVSLVFNESDSIVERILLNSNGTLNDSFFLFESVERIPKSGTLVEYEGFLRDEQDSITESIRSKNYFEKFSKTVMNPEIITESYWFFNEFRESIGLDPLPKPELFSRNDINIKPVSEIRESFVSGNLFSVGDEVYFRSDVERKQVYLVEGLGTNYVVLTKKTGSKAHQKSLVKKWIQDVVKK